MNPTTPQSWFAFLSKRELQGSRDFYFLHLAHALGNRQDGLNVEEITWPEPERSTARKAL